MKTGIWAGAVASAVALGGVVTVIACSSSSVPPVGTTSSSECATEAGDFPAPNCVNYPPDAAMCSAPSVACPTGKCSASSPCLAMSDNSGQEVASLRIRKLNVTAPAVLAEPFIQSIVVEEGINLNGECGEDGDGLFNWLIQVDLSKGTVTTGGAPPVTDPFGTGYCFVNAMVSGIQVGPTTTTLTKNTDGSFSTGIIPQLNVPIYTPVSNGMPSQAIILPLSHVQVKNVTMSTDGNCIGAYNPDGVVSDGGATCADNPGNCDRWNTAGSLGGFITLKQANGVYVPQESKSLCLLLAPGATVDDSDTRDMKCQVDANGNPQALGNYCSTTNAPGGCKDSFWLSATFAASAAKISATPNQPACMGVIDTGDGGTEGGSPTDAGSDGAKTGG